jgi:hypothetical protein
LLSQWQTYSNIAWGLLAAEACGASGKQLQTLLGVFWRLKLQTLLGVFWRLKLQTLLGAFWRLKLQTLLGAF